MAASLCLSVYLSVALLRLLRVLPSCVSVLSAVLVDQFPSSRSSSTAWLLYVQSLLRAAEYAPTLRERLLTVICERITQLDVELATQQQQLSAHAADEEAEEEGDEAEVGEDSVPSSASFVTLVDRRVLASEDARRLDALLCLLLQYVRLLSSPPSQSSSLSSASVHVSSEVFSVLLRVFSASVLRTSDVRCVQFVVFYACSLRHAHAEAFLRWLTERCFDRSADSATRLSCVDYIQSFVARAAFIRHPSAIAAFTSILHWSTSYADAYHDQQRRLHAQLAGRSAPSEIAVSELPFVGPQDAAAHALFYRSFQCLLYVFLYRWRAFDSEMDDAAVLDQQQQQQQQQRRYGRSQDDGDEGATTDAEDVESARSALLENALTRPRLRALLRFLVLSPLDPLRYVMPFIAREFGRVARAVQLMDLRPLLRHQQRRRQQDEAQAASSSGSALRASLTRAFVVRSSLDNGSGLLGRSAEAAGESGEAARAAALRPSFPFDPFFLPPVSALPASAVRGVRPAAPGRVLLDHSVALRRLSPSGRSTREEEVRCFAQRSARRQSRSARPQRRGRRRCAAQQRGQEEEGDPFRRHGGRTPGGRARREAVWADPRNARPRRSTARQGRCGRGC